METHKLQRRLLVGLWIYECCTVTIVLWTGFSIATASGGVIASASPLILIALAESLRVPLAGHATRLSAFNKALAIVVLACLAVASAEGLTLAFDQLIAGRAAGVSKTQRRVDVAQAAVAGGERSAAPLREAITAGEREVAALDAKYETLLKSAPAAPGFSGTTCRSRRGTFGCPADAAAQKTYAAARADYQRQIGAVDAARKAAGASNADLRRKLALIDLTSPAAALTAAQRDLEDALEASPVHRVAASWFGVRAADLGRDQFATFRKWAVGALATSLALLSGLVSWIAHQEPVERKETKLSRALRAYLARRRKAVVRTVTIEGPERTIEVEKLVEVPGPERTVVKYLPQYLSAGEQELRNGRRRGMPTFHPSRPEPIPAKILEASK